MISERNVDTDEERCACFKRLADGIGPHRLDYINADPKEYRHRLARKTTYRQIRHGWKRQNTNGLKRHK